MAPLAGRLAARFGTHRMIAAGMLLLALPYALFFRIGPHSSLLTVVLPVMVVNGISTAATFPALNMSAVTGVPDRDQGLAGALLNTFMQIGGAVVLGVVTTVVEAGQRTNRGDPLAGYGLSTGVIVATVLVGPGRRAPRPAPARQPGSLMTTAPLSATKPFVTAHGPRTRSHQGARE
ncbi:MFS transporter [Streptomyces sp. NBC_01197]|uniref:MFS transporter n=1 Tax=Streptomyces sp. NBC_01197 TaxID=2903768 RepID=UPI002E0EC120|nr:MFS transporter [Streptomyces sp. NBC_01197]